MGRVSELPELGPGGYLNTVIGWEQPTEPWPRLGLSSETAEGCQSILLPQKSKWCLLMVTTSCPPGSKTG